MVAGIAVVAIGIILAVSCNEFYSYHGMLTILLDCVGW
jgi:hypothetical protein